MTEQEYKQELNALDGNIARICVTDYMDDCTYNYRIAKDRLERIYNYRMSVFSERMEHETS